MCSRGLSDCAGGRKSKFTRKEEIGTCLGVGTLRWCESLNVWAPKGTKVAEPALEVPGHVRHDRHPVWAPKRVWRAMAEPGILAFSSPKIRRRCLF